MTALTAASFAAAEIIVVDGGSVDQTVELAQQCGASVIGSERGRGVQLRAGARAANGDWLLFVHADTVLDPGWAEAVRAHADKICASDRAAVFRFALAADLPAASRLEAMVDWRVRRLGLPYGDQGLLISRPLYDEIGGFRALVLMEDVDIIRRIGRMRLDVLAPRAVTSALRYRRSGFVARSCRNLMCLGLYYLGLPPHMIARIYR